MRRRSVGQAFQQHVRLGDVHFADDAKPLHVVEDLDYLPFGRVLIAALVT